MSTRGKREPGYCLAGRATDRVRVGWLPALGSCNEPYKRRHCDMWRITASIAAYAIGGWIGTYVTIRRNRSGN